MLSLLPLVLAALIPENKIEAISEATAAAAITSSLWLPYLKETYEISAYLLPAFGILWLVVQIVAKILITRKQLKSAGPDHGP